MVPAEILSISHIEDQIRDGAADAEIRRVRAFPVQQE